VATDDARTDGVWRDDRRLPLADLVRAVAVSANDGQTDDLAGNDAGIEQALEELEAEEHEIEEAHQGDPDPMSCVARALRSDFTGPVGPH
jgi:hypothetical protein